MSEPTPIASDSAAAAPEAENVVVRTFWSRAMRIYRSRALNRIALFWVLFLIAMAIFVPFIANATPYTCVIDGKREFPLFRNLTRIDLILLVVAVAAVAATIAWRLIEKGGGEIEQRRAARVAALGIIFGLALLISLGIAILKKEYLDSRDYKRLTEATMLKSAIFPPLRWGYKDQEPLERGKLFAFPSREHLLGTDGNGRDALARLLWSTRVALAIGVVSELIALFIGVIYGAMMGYFAGKVDLLGMRALEIVEAVPQLLLLITCVALYGRDLLMLMVIIGVTSWTGIATFVRAEFLKIRKLDYVQAATAMGLPLHSILFRHMLPNGLTPVIIIFTFGVAGAVVSESVLSFLGIGVEAPTASWGLMLNEAGNPAETFRWWLAIAPGLLIFLTVFAYNVIGEGLRDAIDPQLNKVE